MCNSNKGTGGMECSVVLFKPRIHLFACTHPSVSNSLDCNDWLAYKHQSTALYVQTRGSLLFSSIGLLPCVSEPFELWILVCVHASVSSLVFQTRLICGSLSVYTHPSTLLCFKRFCLWLLVCLHASVLSQNGYGMGQTETPLREEWCFVFLQIDAILPLIWLAMIFQSLQGSSSRSAGPPRTKRPRLFCLSTFQDGRRASCGFW